MWVSRTDGLMPAGQYTFDAKGRMVNPPVEPDEPDVPDVPNPPVDPEPDEPVIPDEPAKNGIVNENGGLFYYVDGVLQEGAGLVQLTDDAGDVYYIYVRSNGQLAIGSYWVSITNGLLESNTYTFDANGKYYPSAEEPEQPEDPNVKNGVVLDADGKLRYYVNGQRYNGYGIVKLTDDLGLTYYIYIRSSTGCLVTGTYWPTHTNGYLSDATYDWGPDGKYYPASEPVDPPVEPDEPDVPTPPVDPEEPPVDPDVKNGIYKEGNNYYYYINDVKQAGIGVQKLVDEDGKTFYIYVRSSGVLATGQYWPTIRNGLLEDKPYNWGTDGRYYPG
jgi:hypothetical protein